MSKNYDDTENYCKYVDGVTKEGYDLMLEKPCKSCPLNKL